MSKLKLNIQRFSATNHTAHYNLSQYISTDKPTYLVDYNSDMLAIDTAIYNAMSKATVNEANIGTMENLTTTSKTDLVSALNEVNNQVGTNTGNISTNTSNIATLGDNQGDLANLTTTAKNNLVSAINEVKGVNDTQNNNIGNLSNLNTTDKSSLVSAINENHYNINNLNLTNYYSVANADITVNSGTFASNQLKYATNNDGSLAKIYGYIEVTSSQAQVKVSFPTTLRPSSEINISPLGICNGGTTSNIKSVGCKIATDGTVTIDAWNPTGGSHTFNFMVMPCLIYVKDFGDQPLPSN